MTEEMSFQVMLENCLGFSIPDEGGKFIPPARNSEWKRSGTWFYASLWLYHEATLARRSQTSGGDVDCYKGVEVGGCWAWDGSICKHQCLELDARCNWEPVQGVTITLVLWNLKCHKIFSFFLMLNWEVKFVLVNQFVWTVKYKTTQNLFKERVTNWFDSQHCIVLYMHTLLCKSLGPLVFWSTTKKTVLSHLFLYFAVVCQ